jgi:hypothetical protein
MDIFGITVPLWAIFLGVLLVVVVIWKFIKFAIKLFLILIVFFAILIGLDFFDVFGSIQDALSSFFGII